MFKIVLNTPKNCPKYASAKLNIYWPFESKKEFLFKQWKFSEFICQVSTNFILVTDRFSGFSLTHRMQKNYFYCMYYSMLIFQMTLVWISIQI